MSHHATQYVAEKNLTTTKWHLNKMAYQYFTVLLYSDESNASKVTTVKPYHQSL